MNDGKYSMKYQYKEVKCIILHGFNWQIIWWVASAYSILLGITFAKPSAKQLKCTATLYFVKKTLFCYMTSVCFFSAYECCRARQGAKICAIPNGRLNNEYL